MKKDYFSTVKKTPSTFDSIVDNRAFTHTSPLSGGYSWIQAGMNYFPLDSISAKLGEMECLTDYNVFYRDEINFLDARKRRWEAIINQQPTLYEYLRDVIYA
jgi:hypothetical protein